jgi:hypothetical protein
VGREGILSLGFSGAAWSSMVMYTIGGFELWWGMAATAAMHLGWSIELFLKCKCDKKHP